MMTIKINTLGHSAHISKKIARRFIKLRYQLMPYIIEQFELWSQEGKAIQRPLFYDFQDDPIAQEIDDQFMFGGALMVAPIMEEKSTQRRVYLPKGQWRHIFTDEVL